MRPWTPFTIQAATAAIPSGAKATMMRRRMPQVTTEGPESHKILRRGGRLRKARTRSPHALLTFCLASGIKIYDAVRLARAAPDWFQITCASSHPCAPLLVPGYSRLDRIRRRPERAFCKLVGMAASDSFLQPDRKITRRKRAKRIQHNVHRIGVAGEIQEIE